MSENKRNVPRLRFPEFKKLWEENGGDSNPDNPYAWEQRKFSDFTEYESSNYSAFQFEKDAFDGQYSVFDANKEVAKIDEYDQENEYISIIKDGAGVGRTELRPAKSSIIGTMGYIKTKNCDVTFVYQLMQNINWSKYQNGSTIPHIYYKDYGADNFCVPKIQEQTAIGAFFSTSDTLITLHQRKLKNLQNLKKSLLQQMFV